MASARTLQASSSRLRFGVFEADLGNRQLFKHGRRIRVHEQPIVVLLALLEKPGEIVSRNELRQRLWPRDTHVEYDDGLNSAVRKLRVALSDSADCPHYIETVARSGYKFIAPVTSASGSAAAEPVAVVRTTSVVLENPARRSAQTRQFASWVWRIIGVLAVVALAASGTGYWSHQSRRAVSSASPSPSEPPLASIAVLPLETQSAGAAEDYFAEGLTDDLTAQLGRFPALKVISRTSAVQYKSSGKTAPEIGRELGVDAILEGTVDRSGQRVRVHVQLIRAATGQPIWVESYDRELADILGLESDLAQGVAKRVRVQVAPPPTRASVAHPVNPAAFEEFLRGRYFWNRRDSVALGKALESYQRAIDTDPSFPPPYAGLASCYLLLGSVEKESSAYPSLARSAANRALRLNPELSEAHSVLALLDENEFNFREAEHEHKLAVTFGPNDATAHHWYASAFLVELGRFDEADAVMKQALALDPVSRIIATDWGAILYFERRNDEAFAELTRVIEMAPEFAEAYMWRAMVLVEQAKNREAIADLERAVRLDPTPPRWATLGWALGVAGRRAPAKAVLTKLRISSKEHSGNSWLFAMVHMGLGEKDEALASLEKAYTEHDLHLIPLRVAPLYDSLRGNARFERLLARLRLR